ncbi:MAG: methionine synthase, partial [Chloroflexi bacterium]|nr:methionine synthase [Chloroflexota bacterium]
LKAAWQEKELARLSKNTIIFIDEPYMSSFGSSYVPISRDKVIGLLEEVMGGVRGLKAVHCCGNTDWSVLLATSLDILSFDTYGYAGSLALFPAEVKKLLERGGAVAWGVVPNDKEALGKETAATLKDRLEEAMAPFTRKGIAFRKIVAQSLLTPCCGLASLTIPEAEQAMRLLTGLSDLMRSRYT